MKRIKARIEGISAILMNPATKELLDELAGGAGARKPKNLELSPEQIAANKIIRNGNGEIGIPLEYVFSCLVEAGRQVKLDGKRSISTKESTLLPSFLTIEELFFPFLDQEAEWLVDRRRGRLPNGTAVCITRPRFNKWSFWLTFLLDEKKCSEEKAKKLFEVAGSAVGLGDFRPARRGPFGRFKVVEWKEIPVV